MLIERIDTNRVLPKKKRVCAYARVSVEKETMLHSLSYQVSYYSRFIQSHSDWLFAGIYTDEGLTGTKANRPGFKRMLEDAREGKIDMIIVKSVSRFARNTVDLLKACRELKELNIDVFFEEQNINSLSYEGELMLTLQASIAQEESRSMSENIKWKIRKDMQEGLPQYNRALGYEIKNRKVRIIESEANIVKLAFAYYLEGNGLLKVARMLNEKGYRNVNGALFKPTGVGQILRNYTYTGNLLLQKTFRDNHLNKKKKTNHGELPQYLIRNNHEAIVSLEDFEAVAARLNKVSDRPKEIKRYPFSNMIVCGYCGEHFRRKTANNKTYYCCRNRINRTLVKCESKQIPEEELYRMSNEALGITNFDEMLFKSKVKRIETCIDKSVTFVMKNGEKITKTWNFKSRKESWTEEMKARARERAIAGRRHNGSN